MSSKGPTISHYEYLSLMQHKQIKGRKDTCDTVNSECWSVEIQVSRIVADGNAIMHAKNGIPICSP